MNATLKYLGLAAVLALGVAVSTTSPVQAGYGRQYYSGWSYSYSNSYYYSSYYYKPYYNYSGYNYNYCIYYPSQPSYVYYYNPYRNVYWGRFDVNKKAYSLLAEKDRSGQLKDIPEKAFPEPGPMPSIPDAKDGETVAEPKDLPKGEPPAKKAQDATKADTPADTQADTTKPVDPMAPAEGTKSPDVVPPTTPAEPVKPVEPTKPAEQPGVTPPQVERVDPTPPTGDASTITPPVTPGTGVAPGTGTSPATGTAPATGVAPVTGGAPVNGAAPATGVAPATGGAPVVGGKAPLPVGKTIIAPPVKKCYGGCHSYYSYGYYR